MCFVWPPTWRPCTRTASIWASSWTGSTSSSRSPPSRSPRQSPGTRGWRPPPLPRSCGTCSSCSRHMNLQGPIDSEFWYRYIQHPIFGDFLVKNCAFYKNCADCCDIDAKIVLCIVSKSTHSVPECGFEGLKTYPAPAHIWDLPRWWKSLLLVYKIFHMRTCGLSHQIMGPTTVKVAKTGFMRKIANLQLEVPYFDMIVQKCACEKS